MKKTEKKVTELVEEIETVIKQSKQAIADGIEEQEKAKGLIKIIKSVYFLK